MVVAYTFTRLVRSNINLVHAFCYNQANLQTSVSSSRRSSIFPLLAMFNVGSRGRRSCCGVLTVVGSLSTISYSSLVPAESVDLTLEHSSILPCTLWVGRKKWMGVHWERKHKINKGTWKQAVVEKWKKRKEREERRWKHARFYSRTLLHGCKWWEFKKGGE